MNEGVPIIENGRVNRGRQVLSSAELAVVEKIKNPIENIPLLYKTAGYTLNPRFADACHEGEVNASSLTNGGAFFESGKFFRQFVNKEHASREYFFSEESVPFRAREDACHRVFEKNRDTDLQNWELEALYPSIETFVDEKVFLDMQERVETVGEKIITGTIHDSLFGVPKEIAEKLPTLPVSPLRDKVGDCKSAEAFFFDFMEGSGEGASGFQLIVDEDGNPLALHKTVDRGEPSALLLTEVTMNNIRIPPGSLLTVSYKTEEDREGTVVPLSECKGFQFLRWSSFCLPPKERPEITPSLYHNIQKPADWHGVDTDWYVEIAKKALERFGVAEKAS